MRTKFKDVKQNTKEWWDLKLKRASSSNFAVIMANGDKFGKPAEEYAFRLALEITTGVKDESKPFKNSYMTRGNDMEYLAKERYEEETFINVLNGGFFYSEKFGDSPDGNVIIIKDSIKLVGAVEFKVVIPKVQRDMIKKGGYDTSYKWQIAGHFLLGKKDFVDFVQFCPEMPKNKQIYIFRIWRVDFEDMIESLEIKLNLFWGLVEGYFDFLNSDSVEFNCLNL